MLRLADLTARQTGATDRRLDGAFYLATILSIAAMLALRDWARRRGE